MIDYITIASGLTATVFGYGELMCGDIGKPAPCALGATTASGEPFDPEVPMVAVPAPTNKVMRAQYVWLRVEGGECKKLRLNDKKNPRYIGNGGFDLTPAAVLLLTGKQPNRYWSGKVFVCEENYELFEIDESSSDFRIIRVDSDDLFTNRSSGGRCYRSGREDASTAWGS